MKKKKKKKRRIEEILMIKHLEFLQAELREKEKRKTRKRLPMSLI